MACVLLCEQMYEYLGSKGFNPGAEFHAAIREGKARGIPVVFGDQHSSETMKNIGATLSLPRLLQVVMNPQYQSKMMTAFQAIEAKLRAYNAANPNEALKRPSRIVSGGTASAEDQALEALVVLAEAMKNRETSREMVALMHANVPEIAQALIFDRDVYLWRSLQRLADEPTAATTAPGATGRRVVVGVVGFGHLDGIEKEFRKATGRDKLGGSGNAARGVTAGGSGSGPIQLPPSTPPVIHL